MERHALTEEAQLMAGKEAPQSGDELAAKDAAEYTDGKKEATPGGDPTGMIQSETAGDKYAVDMWMKTPTATIP
jgi:hypothetical protein